MVPSIAISEYMLRIQVAYRRNRFGHALRKGLRFLQTRPMDLAWFGTIQMVRGPPMGQCRCEYQRFKGLKIFTCKWMDAQQALWYWKGARICGIGRIL